MATPLIRLAVSAFLGAALISCGGGGDGPTTPALTCPSAAVPLCTDGLALSAARDGANDAAGRSAPALENTTARSALGSRLSQLGVALGAGDITTARTALTSARSAIAAARAQSGFSGDAPDLASIELLLDRIAPLLGVS